MPKKRTGQKTPSYGFAAGKSSGKKMDSYEDTIEPGSVDDFMFKRDQIMFNPQDESDEDMDVGDEVMAIRGRPSGMDEDEVDYDDDEAEGEVDGPTPKGRKEKPKKDVAKGRFGKAIPDSDDSESGSSGSESEEEEGWGRQYYAMPSARREKQKEDEYDERREEDRELEEREVRRLQRKARENLDADDFGLEDDEDEPAPVVEEESAPVLPPTSTDPAVLLRHMEVHEPIKLALTREWPLVVAKLEKTQRGMRKLEADKDANLHKGLGWLHYQTLVTYASTLAFYIHLAALPAANRPDLSTHPILARLYELKKGLADLEDLDFDAASNDGGDPLLPPGWEDDEEDSDEDLADHKALVRAKKELIAKMMSGEEDDEWRDGDLEEDELAQLIADADADAGGKTSKNKSKGKKNKTSAKRGAKEMDMDMDMEDYEALLSEEPTKKSKKAKQSKQATTKPSAFQTLTEPVFGASTSRPSRSTIDDNDMSGDPSALLDADAEDKAERKRSLAFHTSKIASTASRRAAAREKRMSGDEDVPRRDRQAARDAALRKQNRGADGAPLDGAEFSEVDRKRAREIRGDSDDEGGDGEAEADEAEGYYDLVKRARLSSKAAKQAAHEEEFADRLASRFGDDDEAEGPRSLTRAIEKNRGLTPRRSKSKGGRNPRVKKRQQYEKAKQRVGSQRAVFKGGQAAQGGKYEGEKTGISTVGKSSRF